MRLSGRVKVVGHAEFGAVTASHQARTRGAANRGRRESVGQGDALAIETVDIAGARLAISEGADRPSRLVVGI